MSENQSHKLCHLESSLEASGFGVTGLSRWQEGTVQEERQREYVCACVRERGSRGGVLLGRNRSFNVVVCWEMSCLTLLVTKQKT